MRSVMVGCWRAAFLAFVCLCGADLSTIAIAAPPLSTYGSLPAFEMAAMSASGKRVAMIGVVGEKRRLIITEDGKLVTSGELGGQKIRGLYWAGDAYVLISMSNTEALGIGFTTDKAELYGMVVVPVSDGRPWQVFAKAKSIAGGVRGFHGLRERKGQWYGYLGGITLERMSGGKGSGFILVDTSPELYEVDLSNGDSKRIAARAAGDVYRTWLVGPDGSVAASLDFLSGHGDWRIRNRENKVIRQGTNPRGGIDLVALGTTPDTIIYSQDDEKAEDKANHWFELPQTGTDSREVLADEATLSTFTDERSGQMIGYLRDQDQPEARFFNPRNQKVIAATRKAFPDLNVELIDWNSDFSRLIVKTDGIGDAGTWWTVNIATGQAEVLGAAYLVESADVGPMRMLDYTASDGLKMAGVLTLPPGREPRNLPLIMMPHGGPHVRDYPNFDWLSQALASRGYAVFQPNFRGSTGYGAQFLEAGRGEWGGLMQSDISDGLAKLARQGIVDPKRTCIVGASYGGYAALAGVTLQQGLYRCAVSLAGVSDLFDLFASDMRESGGNQTLRRYLTEDMGSGRDLKAVSPINFAERADAPILLIHGKDDTVVPFKQSKRMEAALVHAGKQVEFVTLEGEDHWLSKGATRLSMLNATVDFVEKYNPQNLAQQQK